MLMLLNLPLPHFPVGKTGQENVGEENEENMDR
jgi:hypothetical protein